MKEQKVKFILKPFPLHKTHPNLFLHYNLYSFSPEEGTEKSIPLKYPCVREGCSTACYFEGKNTNNTVIKTSCQYCGNTNPKIYLDIGYKQFIAQHFKYIREKTPLDVEINPLMKTFRFSSTNIKNNLISKMSQYIGQALVRQLALDEIPVVYKNMLDFSTINKELQPIFVPQYHKKNSYLYSFCKYHPQPREDRDKNHILLFLYNRKSPLKVNLIGQQQKNFCSNTLFLNSCMLGFIGESNTFVMGVPKKEGMKYYVSSLDLHFNMIQQRLVFMEQQKWKEEVSRFGGRLIVDQETSSVYVIGGFDPEKNLIPDQFVKFQSCRWIHKDEKYQMQASIKKAYKELTPTFLKKGVLIENCSFSLQTLSKFGPMKKCLYSLGGTVKDFNFFSSGYQKNKQTNIRYFDFDCFGNDDWLVYEKHLKGIIFPHQNYIIFEIPQIEGNNMTNSNSRFILVFGGQKKESLKQRVQDDKLTNIYLIDKQQPEFSKKIQGKFEYGDLLSSNLDSFISLLFDKSSKSYYVRGTYPLRTPLQTEKGSFVHYIMVEFDVNSLNFRVIPGTIEQF